MGCALAVLFDLDGTLLDSEQAHYAASNAALLALGLGPLPWEEYTRWMYGRPDRPSFRDYLAARGLPTYDTLVEELVAAKARAFAEHLSALRLFPDAAATLQCATQAGVHLGIVTGARRHEAEWVVQHLLDGLQLDVLVTGDDVRHGKPDPEPYLLAAQRLQLPPTACVVVEDTPAGIQAAKAAQMRCLAVDRAGTFSAGLGADRIVSTLSWEAIRDLAALACDP